LEGQFWQTPHELKGASFAPESINIANINIPNINIANINIAKVIIADIDIQHCKEQNLSLGC
jgi:hypothetical protein